MLRYLATGVLGATLNVAGAIFLTEYAGLNYLVSLTICSVIVIVIGFFLNRSWTFNRHGTRIAAEFIRYALVTGVNIPIGLVACALLVNAAGIPYAYSLAIVAVAFAPITFIIHRAWTFGMKWMRDS